MKPLLLALVFCSIPALAEDQPLPVQPGKIVAQPDLTRAVPADLPCAPFGPEWIVKHGSWHVQDGAITVSELPENKHAAVLWHLVPLQSAIVECEFQFDGGKAFIIGNDSAAKHVGRLVITAKGAKLSEDSSEIKGKQPGGTLAEAALDLKPGQWVSVHLEWTGDRMAARVDGKELQGRHPTLTTKKARWWFAVSGAKVRIRNVKVTQAQ